MEEFMFLKVKVLYYYLILSLFMVGYSAAYTPIQQFIDTNGNGRMDSTDSYPLFRSGITEAVADPTIMELNGYWYISGTNAANNFHIYRTSDFVNFESFKYAFAGGANASGIMIGNRNFVGFWSPHLFYDPSHPQTVTLIFSAVSNVNSDGERSQFIVQMNSSDFQNATSYFDPSSVKSFYYRDASGNPKFDGGYSINKPIPASGDVYNYIGSSCGQLEPRKPTGATEIRSYGQRCWNACTWINNDAFLFIDTNPNVSWDNTWKRVLLYDWADAYGKTKNSSWGDHVAAHPVNDSLNEFFSTVRNISIAASVNKSANHRMIINGRTLYNGEITGSGTAWNMGGVAEAPSAIYLNQTNRYYVMYSRNCWDSSAYQLVYRMSAAGASSFASMADTWLNQYPQEYILLRNPYYADTSAEGFGSAEFFNINGQPCMIYHVKFRGSTQRTIMFKELTIQADGTFKPVLDTDISVFYKP